MNPPRFLAGLLLAVTSATAFAAAVPDREAAVRQDRATMEFDSRWIYNDFERGFAEAKGAGKPLLIVLRCVPCLSCVGLDAEVLTAKELTPLLDQFVCVRLINANAIDLARFQFDYDLSLSVLMFNGDGTIYGRYGSWSHQKDPTEKTTLGFRRALAGALAIHRGYPTNKPSLTGKQGGPIPFKTPLEIPELAGKYQRELNWDGKVVPSCVHCHQIGDAYRAWHRAQGRPLPSDLIYPMPMPETIGLTLTPDEMAKVSSVTANSPAARAGIQAGDEIISFDGQPMISIADVAWALHRAPDTAGLAMNVKRDNTVRSLTVSLPEGWRTLADISRRVGTWGMRGMATGGMVLVELSEEERARRHLAKDQLALLVKSVGQYGKHAAAKNAGFKPDDVIVEMAGLSTRLTEGQLIGQLLQKTRPGEKLKVVVLRGEQRVELSLPMQ